MIIAFEPVKQGPSMFARRANGKAIGEIIVIVHFIKRTLELYRAFDVVTASVTLFECLALSLQLMWGTGELSLQRIQR
jgi:hypothetical protein